MRVSHVVRRSVRYLERGFRMMCRQESPALRLVCRILAISALLTGCDGLIVSPRSPLKPFATTPSGDCKVTVWLKAFINPWATDPAWITHVLLPSAHEGEPALFVNPFAISAGSPNSKGDLFLTDDRTFNATDTAHSRMHSQVEFAIPTIGTPKLYGIPSHTIGWTLGIDRTGFSPYEMDTQVCWDQAPESNMHWNSARHLGDTLWIDLEASAANPCISFAPSIDYAGYLKVMQAGNHVHIAF